jgi:hypothetical protein
MKRASTCILSSVALIGLSQLTEAQTAHYVPGVEGIKGASLPPPGVYLRDYNVFYYADRYNDSNGHEVSALGTKAFVYAQVPRVLWITELKALGGNLGVDGLLPLQYTDLKMNGLINDRTFGIGDVFAEVTWSAHVQQFDLSAAYGIWAPSGDSAPGPTTRAGHGYWSHMLTAGATWYIDADKKWAVSALNRYEISTHQDNAVITPGHAYTLEWGVSRTVITNMDVGAVGYYQQKVTTDASGKRDRVAGVGPEVSSFCPRLGVNTSLRYIYEFAAENRPEGHTLALTLTRRF